MVQVTARCDTFSLHLLPRYHRGALHVVDGGLCVPHVYSAPGLPKVEDFCRTYDKVRVLRISVRRTYVRPHNCAPRPLSHLRFRICLQTLPPSYTLANVIYQANLVTQETCGPCCDGYHVCEADSVCRPTSGPRAVCVPATATKTDMCGTSVDMAQQVACEICGAPSPAAKLFEERHITSRRLLQTSSSQVGSRLHH